MLPEATAARELSPDASQIQSNDFKFDHTLALYLLVLCFLACLIGEVQSVHNAMRDLYSILTSI